MRKNSFVIKLAMWIKNNPHSLRETALLFFALALFGGVIWISGKDVEPIVWFLASISTLVFVSPKLARFVLPDTKPVRQMNYDEILDFVEKSNAKLEWKLIQIDCAEEAFLKEDPRLRIRVQRDDAGIHSKNFNESWVAEYSNPIANSYWHDLAYDGALIDRFVLVSVDGGQAELPMPDPTTLEVDPLTYKVAQIFDQHHTLEEYMKRAGLSANTSGDISPK